MLALVIISALALQIAPVGAQQQSAINTYAIVNARIVTLAGPLIERGTVVMRDGLISQVGANTKAPADARIIDGTGLTIYPGLMDAYTNLGMPQPAPATARSSSGGGAVSASQQTLSQLVSSPNSSQPPGLQPELLAVDLLQPGGEQIEAARSAGITTALTAPREGILIGQSALINLAGDSPRQMILRTPVALHVGFTPLRGGTYPASLLGVFSALRQMLLDAQRYREAQAVYERSPRGLRRPEQDKSLAALVPVLARQLPVVMLANTEREIRRALDLAEEFNLRVIIAGGSESWKVTERLRKQDVPVLLSLNFPRRRTAQVPEADPEPLRTLRERVDAPKTAARLSAARVRFAFQSGSMTDMSSYLSNAARTIENGLARDEALRALTLRPAEILGVADRLGTIEAGKIANLTVMRGDIFEKNARIAHVFIDGRPIDLKPSATTTNANAAGAPATGTWTLNVNLGEGETAVTLILQQEGEQLRGSIQGALGSGQISSASVGQGGDLRFTVPINIGGLTTEATFTGTISGNEMRGTIQVVGRSPGSFTGTRPGGGGTTTPATRPGTQPPPATPTTPAQPAAPPTALSGTWDINFVIGEQAVPATLVLERRGVVLTGKLQGPFPTAEIIIGSAGTDAFRFTTLVQLGGQNVELTFEGIVSETLTRTNGVNDYQSYLMRGTVSSTLGTVEFTGSRPKEVMSNE
jgi:imidazolonepropionase-like amidohydrolase